MLLSALLALGGAFFFLVLRVQGSGGSFPKPLSPEEEHELLCKMQEGDEAARAKLIEHNLRLVAHIVKKYYADRAEQDDLISIGTIGLIKAVSTFNADKNIKLATYASKCIQNELLMHFRQKRKSAGELSLSDSLDTDADGNALNLMDVICCEDLNLQAVEEHDRYDAMHQALAACLTPREREIIRLRYGLGTPAPLTQREVARHLDISRSYVSRIEKKALEKLRESLEHQND
ncbi:RNA polymerase sporulation sigma factor SigK [Butyricicoccus sp. Marseille-Q5471]|uniref:RNA polymerase sporulation sigma factor SigK n=1 Tax=Butyricicoccus sp. Marseille-Q5471 TaxID=3039493 RepID=UPI0024BBFFF5|nr:RNA polymerase sporulation sigma factor SigK [Butyricicoccus sp. Marseille-Q5471]